MCDFIIHIFARIHTSIEKFYIYNDENHIKLCTLIDMLKKKYLNFILIVN